MELEVLSDQCSSQRQIIIDQFDCVSEPSHEQISIKNNVDSDELSTMDYRLDGARYLLFIRRKNHNINIDYMFVS